MGDDSTRPRPPYQAFVVWLCDMTYCASTGHPFSGESKARRATHSTRVSEPRSRGEDGGNVGLEREHHTGSLPAL